jgi:hypothetical protein
VWQAIVPAGGLSGRRFDFGHLSPELEKPSGACIQPAAGFSPPSWYAANFLGFVSLKRCAAKLEKFVKIRGSRLKAGCSLEGRRPTDHSRSSHLFLRLRVRRHPAAKPEKFVAYRKHARLPAPLISFATLGGAGIQPAKASAARPFPRSQLTPPVASADLVKLLIRSYETSLFPSSNGTCSTLACNHQQEIRYVCS